jgi:predicted solute-binding protein
VAGPLRIGCVKYLNARPLIHGWRGEVVFETPTALCEILARGELDVALASSFEFLRNPIYKIVDLVSISSDGPVYSVILAHEPGSTVFEEIELDPASQTSVAILRCLLAERGEKFSTAEMPGDKLSAPHSGRARLLIGDQAIRFRQKFGERFSYVDLGAEWKKIVDLPFVYALWLVRPEFADAENIADQLRSLRDENLGKIDNLVPPDFDRDFGGRYFRENVRFDFGDREKEGLRIFGELCVKHGLLLENPKKLALI